MQNFVGKYMYLIFYCTTDTQVVYTRPERRKLNSQERQGGQGGQVWCMVIFARKNSTDAV